MTLERLTATALLRLLHLASPSLPVGAYSYSQGLESAIDAGIVSDEATTLDWIKAALALSVARFEAPAFCRLYRAWSDADQGAIDYWTEFFLAARDSAEFRAETVQMGYSLARLLHELFPDEALVQRLPARPGAAPVIYPGAMAAACVILATPLEASLHAYIFSWAENQVLAALKAAPVGQAAGQRILFALEPDILAAAASALAMADADISNWAPGLSLLSMRHETQYSRIFRS